jgi:hypothetical protein
MNDSLLNPLVEKLPVKTGNRKSSETHEPGSGSARARGRKSWGKPGDGLDGARRAGTAEKVLP